MLASQPVLTPPYSSGVSGESFQAKVKDQTGATVKAQHARPGPKLESPYRETPIVYSSFLSRQLGAKVWLKMENLQPSGSFKSRGLGHHVHKTVMSDPERSFSFYIASGGNAGYAAAYAAGQYRQKCTVCLPTTSDPNMVRRIEMTGAKVVVVGGYIAEADEFMREKLMPEAEARGEHTVYLHPYNHETVWEGNTSLGEELLEQTAEYGFKPDAVVCSVGGGGLYNGIVRGFQAGGWGDVPIVAVETAGCATLNMSLEKGEQVTLAAPKTIAVSLATCNVTNETIEFAKNVHPTHSVVISDKDAVESVVQFAADHKQLVEPACAAALSPIYTGLINDIVNIPPGGNVVAVLCGGTNFSWSKLQRFCEDLDVELDC